MSHRVFDFTMTVAPKANDDVATPPALYHKLNDIFHFDAYDPCPLYGRGGVNDGLVDPWPGCVFVNPPYSDIPAWLRKAHKESERGCTVVMLVPVRTATTYWRELVWPRISVILFITQRVTFPSYPREAPFGLCVLVFSPSDASLTSDALTSDALTSKGSEEPFTWAAMFPRCTSAQTHKHNH